VLFLPGKNFKKFTSPQPKLAGGAPKYNSLVACCSACAALQASYFRMGFQHE